MQKKNTIILTFFVIFLYNLFKRYFIIIFTFNIIVLKNCFRQNLKGNDTFPTLNSNTLLFFNTSILIQFIILYLKMYKTNQFDKQLIREEI